MLRTLAVGNTAASERKNGRGRNENCAIDFVG